MTPKETLRAQLEQKRKTLAPEARKNKSLRIIKRIQTLDAFKSAKWIALYKAIGGEVDLDSLFQTCWALGKQTCIPIFNAQTRIYELAAVGPNTAYKIGHYGIQEPATLKPVTIQRVNLMVLPGIAFDRCGNRLGRGGGYYDRLMHPFSGHAAAVGYDFQLLPCIPCEPHDVPVNTIITESEIVNVLNEH